MTPALALLGYAVAAAWCAPALLTRLTGGGASPRLGLAAWLAAMGSVITALVLGAGYSARTAAADWPQFTAALCRSVAGGACTPQVYRSALYEGGVTAFALVVALLLAAALWRYGRRVQRSRAGTQSHARAALLVGRAMASAESATGTGAIAGIAARIAAGAGIARDIRAGRDDARAVVLDDPRPAAYCVAGHPAAIVVTSGALAVLDEPQLAAVLSHERAHLNARHHALLLVTRGLTAAFPGVPLFTGGAAEIARLTEMAADDTASRAHGRPTVAAALLSLATAVAAPRPDPGSVPNPRPTAERRRSGMPHPGGRLAVSAAAYAVPARVERLLRPRRPALAAAFAIPLTLTLAVLAAVPPLVAALVR